jgi:rare lipoprotein A
MFVCLMPLSLIQTHPLQAEELPKEEKEVQGGQARVTEEATGVKGIATYYAKRYNGRKTTSGERYRPEKLTAAHPNLPWAQRSENLDNENEVVVRKTAAAREGSHYRPSSAAARKINSREWTGVHITRLAMIQILANGLLTIIELRTKKGRHKCPAFLFSVFPKKETFYFFFRTFF